jgi:hypothetical protein
MPRETLMTRHDADLGVGLFDSIAWAFEVHVRKPDDSRYQAAILYGNEDSPERIDFYFEAEPLVTSTVAYTWVPEVQQDHE